MLFRSHKEYYDILANELDTDFMEEYGFITKKERTSADIDEDLMSRLEEMVKAQFEEETKNVSKNIEEEKSNLINIRNELNMSKESDVISKPKKMVYTNNKSSK